MTTNKILLKFAKKGINLSPEAYNIVNNAENPLDFASSLIVKLKSDKYSSKDLVSVSEDIINEITGKQKENNIIQKTLGHSVDKKEIEIKSDVKEKIDDLKKESDNVEKYINPTIVEASETIKDEKIEFKRNLEKTNVKYDFEILQDTSKKSYTSGEIENLISYFKSRYDKLAKILSSRPELKNYTKIADIEEDQDSLSMILMVKEIRSSKNGHKIIEFEDDTGTISVLFTNKKEDLFKEAEKLVKGPERDDGRQPRAQVGRAGVKGAQEGDHEGTRNF